MTSFENIANAAARTKQLESLKNVGALLFRRGYKLADARARVIERGLATADDMFALGAVNEGYQLEQMESAQETA